MVDLTDEQVGRILDALDRTGQSHRTIIVFMSDHGEMLGDHGICLKGPHFYEPAEHVALIVAWPGMIKPERRGRALVELVDLAPTLIDAVGLEGKNGHKLVVVHGMEAGEMYDLKQDPSETHNRWDDAEYRPVKLEMLKRLCDRMAWTSDPLPVRHTPW